MATVAAAPAASAARPQQRTSGASALRCFSAAVRGAPLQQQRGQARSSQRTAVQAAGRAAPPADDEEQQYEQVGRAGGRPGWLNWWGRRRAPWPLPLRRVPPPLGAPSSPPPPLPLPLPQDDRFQERVVQIRRVTKVVKGGKQLSFRAVVVVGDENGTVGVGCASAGEVIGAVRKAVVDAKRNLVSVPLNKNASFPHRIDGIFGAAKVRPGVALARARRRMHAGVCWHRASTRWAGHTRPP